MYSTLRLLLLTLCVVGLSKADVLCDDPSGHVGRYIGRNQECAALVQTNCHRQPGNRQIGLTSTWRMGTHVKSSCKFIKPFTAIATFLGPNNSYNNLKHRHTAIFVRCEAQGIGVYDQWNGTPINYRVIKWQGKTPQYSGDNYYTIA